MNTMASKRNMFVWWFSAVVVVLLSLELHVDCFRIPSDGKPLRKKHLANNRRRNVIASIPQFASVLLLDPRTKQRDAGALGLPLFFDQQQDRIQKELCLVNLMRLQSWASTVSEKLKTTPDVNDNEEEDNNEDKKKTLYLEARLGSKVMVSESKKISGGATPKVFMLKSLHLRECLDDLTYYADKGPKRQKMNRYREDLIESLASIVEFDGLETTQDPSPRSSLTLTMYNSQKGVFVQRMLAERVVPLIDDILRLFDTDTRAQSEEYMREYYPSEVMVTKS